MTLSHVIAAIIGFIIGIVVTSIIYERPPLDDVEELLRKEAALAGNADAPLEVIKEMGRRCSQCGGGYAMGGFLHERDCPKLKLGDLKAAIRAAVRDGVVAVYPGRVPEESIRHAQQTGLKSFRAALAAAQKEG